MNFDFDNEQSSQVEVYNFMSSPPKPAMDTVDWANSQPSALRNLLLVAKRPEKRPLKPKTTWPGYDDFNSDTVSSTSFDHPAPRARPLRRTNSSQRARLSPDSASASLKPPPAPDDSFWARDRHTVLAACQNVSERMDEDALLQLAKSRDAGPAHRKAKASHLAGVSKARRVSLPLTVAQRQELNRRDKGKQREGSVPETRPHGLERSSLLSYSSSSSCSSPSVSSPATSASSPHSNDTSLTMDVDSADTSMMDIDPHSKPDSSISAPTHSITTTSIPAPNAIPPTHPTHAPTPKLHPLLTQNHSRPLKPLKPPPIPHQRPPPPPAQTVPPLSQSTRPPPLGMRTARGATLPPPPKHALPTRQKGFRPPLLSQPLAQSTPSKPGAGESATVSHHPNAFSKASVRKSSTPQVEEKLEPKARPAPRAQSWVHAPRPMHHAKEEEARPNRSPSPDVNPDADSSFGDMSFDMDALEATMQMYD
ncbi:hypothetical protein FPV67DRAFT_1450050 [Lyophyllum atratum]|nr:hypothetical protein FPV67DRAFT_1450050 [Lyophyllum atratum]